MDLSQQTSTTRDLRRGSGLVEAVIVISIMSVAFAALLNAAAVFVRGGLQSTDRVQAMYLLEEGVEAVRFLRDDSYTTNITPLINAGTRYLAPISGGWVATTTNTTILGKYTRHVTLTPVYRRISDDDIVPSTSADPKAIDPGTAFLVVTVSWNGTSDSVSTYVTDLYGN